MVSGPNLNETSIVSGGYGGTAEGIIPTSSIKGRLRPLLPCSQRFWAALCSNVAAAPCRSFSMQFAHLADKFKMNSQIDRIDDNTRQRAKP